MNDTPTAVAYYRTSSATNVGSDKDSLKRQEDAVRSYAAAHGLAIVHEYYDAAVSGADPVEARPGFRDMLAYMLGNGARTILVENAGRFARDIAIQIAGHDLLKARGITLIPVDMPTHFQDETPTAKMVRNILGVISQFEKEGLVLKLRVARERKRRETGHCEGRPAVPRETVEAAKGLRASGLSLRKVAVELERQGHKAYAAQSIKHMVRS